MTLVLLACFLVVGAVLGGLLASSIFWSLLVIAALLAALGLARPGGRTGP